jgi:hypothetical protein
MLLAALTALLVSVLPGAASAAKAKAADAPDYVLDESTLPFDPLPGFDDATQLWGVHTGAGYQIEVPANWNGDLIMWAHGYRGEGARLFFNNAEIAPGVVSPAEFPIEVRAWMLENGYAWAQSTYSKNGYNVAQGVKDTHALSKRFNGLVGEPTDVFITGYSMGGHITAVSAEQFSRSYTAAMPMCGVVGDYALFDYFLDVNAAAQQIALGTSQFPVGDDYLTTTVPDIKAELGPFFPFVLDAEGLAFAQLVELRSGGDRPGFDDAFRFWNSTATDPDGNFLFGLGTGNGALPGRPGVAVDNIGVVYQTDLDPALSTAEAELNDEIVRVAADRSARSSNGLSNVPKVAGDISIPTLTMHNLGDLFVPFHNEIVYGAEAAASGTSDLLVQRAILGAIHCDFAASEVIAGLSDLITWADGGPRPAGDDVLDPVAVADPQFGCQFTLEAKFAGLAATGAPAFAGCP